MVARSYPTKNLALTSRILAHLDGGQIFGAMPIFWSAVQISRPLADEMEGSGFSRQNIGSPCFCRVSPDGIETAPNLQMYPLVRLLAPLLACCCPSICRIRRAGGGVMRKAC
ncbi:unnamed protein product [Triticum turgidum subsp. durum]|uniref:Uncharacterized protein n=1 Tax=Triticum turgidum subsp. durum TaxID=4567 RepID=A0A9R0U1R5_TRITD|nr:unnamed protein product [Triticum turgidum subsp. durum]